MLYEPFWITEAQASATHAEQLREHGGGDGVRDMVLLHSALARPKQVFTYDKEADLCSLAATYGYGIANNHPFFDGNKRTAFVCMLTFLLINGLEITAGLGDRYDIMIDVASSKIREEVLAEWLRQNTKPTN